MREGGVSAAFVPSWHFHRTSDVNDKSWRHVIACSYYLHDVNGATDKTGRKVPIMGGNIFFVGGKKSVEILIRLEGRT